MSGAVANRSRNRAFALALVAVAVVCAAMAVFYMTVKTTFLASHYGHQPKHAIVLGVVAVLALIAASIVWRLREVRRAPGSAG